DVLVGPVTDQKIHEALVLELVGDDVQWDLVGDARSTELEVSEMDRDEDHALAQRERAAQVLPPVDRDEPLEVRDTEQREPHDLDDVLGEVAERPSRDLRDLTIGRRSSEDDRG